MDKYTRNIGSNNGSVSYHINASNNSAICAPHDAKYTTQESSADRTNKRKGETKNE